MSKIFAKRFDNYLCYYVSRLYYEIIIIGLNRFISDRIIIKRKYKKIYGVEPNLDNPQKLSEKMQWLKLFDRKDLYTICADKYAVREWLSEKYGSEFLVPLIYHTTSVNNINLNNINKFPCIIKANHSSKDYFILRTPNDINLKKIKKMCRWWLHRNYYLESQEWQYKNINRQIIVEELLQTKEGKIPNDYKLHYFNGKLEFIYVSVDREGVNKRNIYDEQWNPLFFDWSSTNITDENKRGLEIPPPPTLSEMVRIGNDIAKLFKYVRVDFYDVDGHLYFGEITLHHGGGFDVFNPQEYDLIYGLKLKI